MPSKLDLKKKPYKHLYYPPSDTVVQVEVPPLSYLMIDGTGDPNTSEMWQHAMSALYSTAYALKFMSKDIGTDFVVMPLEGLWWAETMSTDVFDVGGDRDQWHWTAMIMQPQHITEVMVAQAIATARAKDDASPALARLRFATYDEGLAAQIMHIGPYADEAPTVAKLHAWIEAQAGYTYHGAKYHHEIYLSDPRRTMAEKMKTVIRQPMRTTDAEPPA